MKGEKLIHIKFEYSAGVQSKRDILSTEIDLIKMNKRIQRYQEYRMQELDVKLTMDRKMKAFKLNMGRLQNLMPDLQIPEILDKAHKKIMKERKAGRTAKAVEKKVEVVQKIAPLTLAAEPAQSELDTQLMDIQNKLRSLAG